MKYLSPAGRNVAVAVAVTLAVTAGTAMAGTPALAAPGAAATVAAEQQTGPFALASGEALYGAGSTGFVTFVQSHGGVGTTWQWRRSADGSATILPKGAPDFANPTAATDSDLVAVQTGVSSYRLLDMAGGEPVDIDTRAAVGEGAELWEVARDTLVLVRGGNSLHLVSKPGSSVVHRQVQGLPADAEIRDLRYSPSGALLVRYKVSDGEHLAVVDLAEAKVVEDRAVPRLYYASEIAVSATHLAWSESNADGSVTLVTALRGAAGTTRHTTFETHGGRYVPVALLGDRVVFGLSDMDLSAVSLKDGTTTGLLGDLRGVSASGDDLLARGSTAEHGQGLYRIALDADGRPAVTQVATDGVRTPVSVVDEQVPATAGFGTAGSTAELRWKLNRGDVKVTLLLTHKATGKTWTADKRLLGANTEAAFTWDGAFTNGTAAHNGAYEWRITVTPLNSPTGQVERTGTLQVDSGTAPHDYSDSGSPDLLVREGSGRLASYDVRQLASAPEATAERTERGGGWSVYDRLLSAGNLDASPYADLLARDKDGVLWLYSGTGQSLAPRVRVGSGWGIYTTFAAGSDLTGDGRPDLVATDTAGVLWLYKATGDAAKPFEARVRVGGGWNTYDLLTAPGDIGGAKSGDLLARDRDGVLWLYLGKGDGTFAARSKVGGGWNGFRAVVNIGDVDRDGRADLVAERGSGDVSSLTVYKGTGDWKAPFGAGAALGGGPLVHGSDPIVF
ncbi:VCBS repeat-containing protein [Streptomyces sp. MBT42]|uniref:FG-GAP repeat domain-containing protein n=1 Tax=Streptomyces sp. MBT42 TaxID=1488373 RepID=UPI001E576FF5|nr:VCBS repeat-containing protein [Streptomyces sp. MBT42]MCD2466715.1 VCBS repeat-containing protein [Streptomyces sp. MBT42]